MNRFQLNFDNHFWKSLPESIIHLGKKSRYYKFFKALLNIFYIDFQNMIQEIYNEIFIETRSFESKRLKALDMRITPIAGESNEDFEKRLKREEIIRTYELSTESVKKIFKLYTGYFPVISESNESAVFTIGITPIGVGKCFSSDFFLFTWTAILPDLSEIEVDKAELIRMLNEFSASSEFFIYENRSDGFYKWEV